MVQGYHKEQGLKNSFPFSSANQNTVLSLPSVASITSRLGALAWESPGQLLSFASRNIAYKMFSQNIMEKKKQPDKPVEIPSPVHYPEIEPPIDPEEPISIPPEEIPDIIPEEDPYEDFPYEAPTLGEGP